MLYFPAWARGENGHRAWRYESCYLVGIFFLVRVMLPRLDCFNPDFPTPLKQCKWEMIGLMGSVDLYIFLVDLWYHSLWPWISGQPIPNRNYPLQWWVWLLDIASLQTLLMDEFICMGVDLQFYVMIEAITNGGGREGALQSIGAMKELLIFFQFILFRFFIPVLFLLLVVSSTMLCFLIVIVSFLLYNLLTCRVALVFIFVFALSVYTYRRKEEDDSLSPP